MLISRVGSSHVGAGLARVALPFLAGAFCTILGAGVAYEREIQRNPRDGRAAFQDYLTEGLSRFNGVYHEQILRDGYTYRANWPSNVAHFPGYILAAALVQMLSPCGEGTSLLLVSWIAFFGFLGLCSVLIGQMRREGDADGSGIQTDGIDREMQVVMWVAALWPLSFYFRAAYSESLFCLMACGVLVLTSQGRSQALWGAGLLAGAASAVRPVGVVMAPVMLAAAWRRWRRAEVSAWTAIGVVLISQWGLIAYSLYCQIQFDCFYCFAATQKDWSLQGDSTLVQTAIGSLSLEPIWGTVVPTSAFYWKSKSSEAAPFLSAGFMNPVFVIMQCSLLAIGNIKRWLPSEETIYGWGVILVAYFAHGYRAEMMSQGRYAMAAFPAFFVLARILARSSEWVRLAFFSASASLLALYSWVFVSGEYLWP